MRWLWELERRGLCSVLPEEPLRRWNSWGVGGPAALVLRPHTQGVFRDLRVAAAAEGVPVQVLGEGTNVLVPDEGFPGWVVLLRDDPTPPALSGSRGDLVEVQASGGTPLRTLVGWSLRRGLSGLEFALGIPGTLGGAVAGNAGAQGQAIGDRLSFVETLEPDGTLRTRGRGELSFSYRSSPLEGGRSWVLRAGLSLFPGEEADLRRRVKRFAELRRSQPRGQGTAGCVFRNPPGFSAGRLLDQAGCKGLRRGGARVSEQHANFIENTQDATARDILDLARECRRRVEEQHGLVLEFEVQVLGASV